MTALLEVSGLEAGYGKSQVLFGMGLQVQPGRCTTLLGRNGMGKTTTVKSDHGAGPRDGRRGALAADHPACRPTRWRGWAWAWCPRAGRSSRT
jgi:ABC-type branched-subunit amino acid transport system ATPase component